MRIIFMGTPAFAVPTLDALVDAGHEIAAVYTQPPRPAGRGKAPRPTPIAERAAKLEVETRTPATLRDADAHAAFAALDADVAVVAAYGLILPPPILAAPRLGCFNVHASLLPRWRGAAPIQRAILAGDVETGVCIMDMAAGLDTGPVRARAEIAIGDDDAGTLTARLAMLGAELMVDVLADREAYPPISQPADGVSYAAKIDKVEARLDFSQSVDALLRQVRAFAPAPGAHAEVKGERIRVLAGERAIGAGPPGMLLDDGFAIACDDGAIRPTVVQRAGRPAMATAALLRGWPLPAGLRIG